MAGAGGEATATPRFQVIFEVAGGGNISGESGQIISEQIRNICLGLYKNGATKIVFQADQASMAGIATQAKKIAKVVKTQNSASVNSDNKRLLAIRSLNDYYTKYSATIQNNGRLVEKYNTLQAQMSSSNLTGANAINAVRNFKIEAHSAGVETEKLSTKMRNLFGARMSYMMAGLLSMAVISSIRRLVSNVKEIDTAFTQLQIVTKMTNKEMDEFADGAAKVAHSVAASITSVVDAATVYSRLGFSSGDSLKYAELTTMYSKVGDVDISDAESAITAIIKAFDIGSEDLQTALDKMVEVGNNFPISTSQLGEGLNNAGSALAAAGNSFEESMAILTAAMTVTQDISKASTGVRTISARIRNSASELEELGESLDDEVNTTAKYRAKLLAISGVDILEDDLETFKSTYDILKEISLVWKDLSDIDRASITTMVAGVRQQNVFASIMSEWAEAEGVMKSASGAAGAMSTAYNTYLSSVEGGLEKISASTQSLSTNLIKSEFATWLLKVADILVRMLDVLAKLELAFPVAFGVLALIRTISTMKAATVAAKQYALSILDVAEANRLEYVSSLLSVATTNQETFAILRASIQSGVLTTETVKTAVGYDMLSAAQKKALVSTNALSGGFKAAAASNYVGWILMAVSAIISLVSWANTAAEKIKEATASQIESGAEAYENIEKLTSATNKYLSLIKEIDGEETVSGEAVEEVKSVQEEIVGILGDQAGAIDLVNGKISEQKKLLSDVVSQRIGSQIETLESAYVMAQDRLDEGLGVGGLFKNFGVTQQISTIVDDLGGAWGALLLATSGKAERNFGNALQWSGESGGIKAQLELLKEWRTAILEYSNTGATLDDYSLSLNEVNRLISEGEKAIEDAKKAKDDYFSAQASMQILKDLESVSITSAESLDVYLKSLRSSGEYSKEYLGYLQKTAKEMFPTYVIQRSVDNSRTQLAAVKDLATAYDALSGAIDVADAAEKEMAEGGAISADTIAKLAKESENYLDYLYVEDGVVKMLVSTWREYNAEKIRAEASKISGNIDALNLVRDSIMANINAYEAQRAAYEAAGLRAPNLSGSLSDVDAQISKEKELLSLYEAMIKEATEPTSSDEDAAYKKMKALYEEKQHLLAMDEITEKQYYDWLAKTYLSFLRGKEEYLDEYRKVEEDIYKWQKEQAEDIAKKEEEAQEDIRDAYEKTLKSKKQSLDEQISEIRNFFDKQRSLLEEQRDEEEYLDDRAGKVSKVVNLETEIAMLSSDDSAASRKRVAELTKELSDAKDDLAELERDRAYDSAITLLDKMEEDAVSSIEQKVDSIETILSDSSMTLSAIAKALEAAGLYGEITLPKYASGTRSAIGGLSITNERPEIIASSAGGGYYTMLNPGDKVFSARATQFLYDLANNPMSILGGGLYRSSGAGSAAPAVYNLTTGEINVQGGADEATVDRLRQLQQSQIKTILKELKRLSNR